jgi:hypothetical protein
MPERLKLPHPGLEPHDLRERTKLPPRPMLGRVGQQGVTRVNMEPSWDAACVQWTMVRDRQRRLVPDRPTLSPRTTAQVHVLVIKKEMPIEAAELLEARAAHQQTAAAHPGDWPSCRRMVQRVLPPATRQQHAEQSADQGGEGADRGLPGAVAVTQTKTDQACGGGAIEGLLGDAQRLVQKTIRHRHIRIEQQQPPTLAEPTALIDGLTKAAVTSPTAEGDTRGAPESAKQRMRRRMIVHHHDLGVALLHAARALQLPNEASGIGPAAIVHDDDR